ncbi:MAG TPA: T3SS effector HopA1 family protein [Longimicrobium sp.]
MSVASPSVSVPPAAPSTPMAGLLSMATAIGGNTAAGAAIAYGHYRTCFTPRPGCPLATAQQVMRLLYTMPSDSQGVLRGQGQTSRTWLDTVGAATLVKSATPVEVPMAALMGYALRAGSEKALRVVRQRNPPRQLSRISLTIDGTKTDRVFVALARLTMQHGCIADFKLIVPEEIGSGPDDFIVYFSNPLDHPDVQRAITAIQTEVAAFLVDGVVPLGKLKLAAGIFGSDMPARTVTGTRLNFTGSHGDDRAKIVAEAVRRSAANHTTVAAELATVLQEVGLDPANPARRLVAPPPPTAATATASALPPTAATATASALPPTAATATASALPPTVTPTPPSAPPGAGTVGF